MSVMIPAYAHRNDVGCGNRMATQRHRGGEAGRPPVDASSGQALLPKKHRRKMLRAVGGWLCRGRCKTRFDTKKRASWREMESELPESPATVQLSRANSESSTETEIEEEDLSGDNSKRVTFHMEITTYIIDQMDEEDLSNTFYTRREYMAFKDAYRLHRDSLGWRREYDGMPCDCDSCMDRIVVDYRMFSPESPPVSPPALSPTSPADFERESPTVYDANEREVGFRCEVDEDGNNDVADETWEDVNAPPSPVISTHGTSEEDDDSDGDEDPVTGQHGGMGHRRTNAWTGDRVSPNVSNAVEKYGEDYAYRRLRLQGFSDRYIRTHFMPEGALANL